MSDEWWDKHNLDSDDGGEYLTEETDKINDEIKDKVNWWIYFLLIIHFG